MKSNKKVLMGTVAVGLVAALAIGGTWAYLTDETERRANNFTFASDSIDAMLTEPEWDGVVDYEYNDDGTITPIYDWTDNDNNPDTPDVPVYGYTDGDKFNPITDKSALEEGKDYRPRKDSNDDTYHPTYGDEQSVNMIPGAEASKNPIITNTGIVDEWIAAKVTFVHAAGSTDAGKPLNETEMGNVVDALDIDWKVGTGDDWERIGGVESDISQIFYYKKIVAKDSDVTDKGKYGEATSPIFTKVSVKDSATNQQIKALEDMGGFAIWIEGFAVQKDVSADYNGFKTWAGTGVVFNNTPTNEKPAEVSKPGIIPAQ